MTKSINLSFLLNVFKKAWWKILIFTVIVAVGMGLVAEFLVPKKHSSTVEFMVYNFDENFDYTNTSLTYAAEALAKDYIRIISGDDMIEAIQEYVAHPERDTSGTYSKLTASQIRKMLSSNTYGEGSSIFSITVTTEDDYKLAYYVAECIYTQAPDIITEVSRPTARGANDHSVAVIRKPTDSKQPTSPNVKNYVMISALLAAAASYALFVVIKLFDNVITSEEDIVEKLNITVIGNIPEWSVDDSSRKEENK